jgi:hypothetical protein
MSFRKPEAPEALDDLVWRQQAGSGRFVANPEVIQRSQGDRLSRHDFPDRFGITSGLPVIRGRQDGMPHQYDVNQDWPRGTGCVLAS